jgi:hypothetical protein
MPIIEISSAVITAEVLSTTMLWIYSALTVASVGYSIIQAQKMKDAAKKAAEARKGYEIPVEGVAANIPVCYGRTLIGGARVYHQTKGNFEFVPSGSDKVFLAGLTASQMQVYDFYIPPSSPDASYSPGGDAHRDWLSLELRPD